MKIESNLSRVNEWLQFAAQLVGETKLFQCTTRNPMEEILLDDHCQLSFVEYCIGLFIKERT